MNEHEMKEAILRVLKDKKNPALTPTEIAARLRLRGGVRKRLQRWLNELARAGTISALSRLQ